MAVSGIRSSPTPADGREFDIDVHDRTILRIGYPNNERVGEESTDHGGLAVTAEDFYLTGQAFGRDRDVAPAAERHGEQNKKEERPERAGATHGSHLGSWKMRLIQGPFSDSYESAAGPARVARPAHRLPINRA